MCFLWKFSWCILQSKRGKFGRVVGGGGMDQAFTIRWNSQWRYVGRSRDTSFPIKLLCMLYCETKLAFCIFAQDGTQVQLKSVTLQKYITAVGGGGSNVTVDRDFASTWETFKVIFFFFLQKLLLLLFSQTRVWVWYLLGNLSLTQSHKWLLCFIHHIICD